MNRHLYEWAENDRLLDLLYTTRVRSLLPEELEELDRLMAAPGAEDILVIFNLEEADMEVPEHPISMPDLSSMAAYTNKRIAMRWTRWLAAAAVLVIIAGVYFLLPHSGKNNSLAKQQPYRNDVQPGSSKATLILADGRQLQLTGTGNAYQVKNGNSIINISGKGQLTFQRADQTGGTAPMRNTWYTLLVPAGGQYELELPDGSKVWVNAASKLRFPARFASNSREVQLEGEAFFSVSASAAKPFYVTTPQMKVQVLGTRFNVNAYPGQKARTTLVEGAVKVSPAGNTKATWQKLLPGQQLECLPGKLLQETRDIDPVAAVAWKEGNFTFNGATIQAVMQQIEHWYNVQVVFKDGIAASEHFVGTIPRQSTLIQVLDLLSMTGPVSFEIIRQQVIVHSSSS